MKVIVLPWIVRWLGALEAITKDGTEIVLFSFESRGAGEKVPA
jgi:hypothetical protein